MEVEEKIEGKMEGHHFCLLQPTYAAPSKYIKLGFFSFERLLDLGFDSGPTNFFILLYRLDTNGLFLAKTKRAIDKKKY